MFIWPSLRLRDHGKRLHDSFCEHRRRSTVAPITGRKRGLYRLATGQFLAGSCGTRRTCAAGRYRVRSPHGHNAAESRKVSAGHRIRGHIRGHNGCQDDEVAGGNRPDPGRCTRGRHRWRSMPRRDSRGRAGVGRRRCRSRCDGTRDRKVISGERIPGHMGLVPVRIEH